VAVFNGAFPLQPGKEAAVREFAKACMTKRAGEFNAQQAQADVVRETWTLAETPAGTVVMVWFDGDVEKAFADIGSDDTDFAKWFRGQVKDTTGFDLAAPDDTPPPEVILDWSA